MHRGKTMREEKGETAAMDERNPHPDFNRLYPKKEIDDHTLNKKARS